MLVGINSLSKQHTMNGKLGSNFTGVTDIVIR